MNWDQLVIDLAAVLAASAPLIIAAMGATIGERAGVINLSLDGTILLAAMTGFAVALNTNSLGLGFLAAAAVGALVALVLCLMSLTLSLSQTAVGFVLTLLCTDLSSFLGNSYVRKPGPAVSFMPIPMLSDIPGLGVILFRHDPVIYGSFILIPLIWWFLFRTRSGLTLRALGERPETIYARGVNVNALRFLYVMLGGALVGIAGAAYTLDLKQGWSYRHTLGTGWIALAIVIFGGWNPWRVALGCYLFGILQTLASRWQSTPPRFLPEIPTQVFQVAPFALMIFVLALVNGATNPALIRWIAMLPSWIRRPLQAIVMRISASSPAALGIPFRRP